MSLDAGGGLAVLVLALGATAYLTLRCRAVIERIARERLESVREIVKELHNGG